MLITVVDTRSVGWRDKMGVLWGAPIYAEEGELRRGMEGEGRLMGGNKSFN